MDRRSFSRNVAATGIGLGLVTRAAQAQASDGSCAFPGNNRGEEGGMRSGKLFTITNSAAGNELLVLGADPSGTLALLVRYQTFGLGTSAGLGSQGAVTLSDDGRYVFAVNAGSNTVSVFSVHAGALTLTSLHDSGGLHPISVTESDGIVYVLNDGGAGNVAGFRNDRGTLHPISGSVRPLSAAGGTGPAQVAIGTEGDVLVVTEKNTNRLVTYALSDNGRAGPPRVSASAGVTPFGFAFDRRNQLLVSEAAASSLSSYRFDDRAPTGPILISAAVPNNQAAACWAAASPSGRFVYTGNAGTSSISQYAIDRRGAVTLVNGAAGSTAGGGAGDIAIASHGRTLSILAPRAPAVFSFAVAANGSLTPASSVAGLPTTVVGLAAN
jgi:6-phosphogluconolactonase (cycloisomerase 2 family)